MAVIVDLTCIYSTLRNISGVAKNFPFLPPHGRSMAVDEEVTVFGNILEALTRSNDRFGKTDQDAFEEALRRDWLEIRNTPSPIFTDEVTTGDDAVKTIAINTGSVVVNDPCWESSITV